MISRKSAEKVTKLSTQFPVIVISGARQSGKTTMIRSTFPGFQYVNLERPDILSRALRDPLGFLKGFGKKPVIFDEAQNWPELASWLQGEVDEDPVPGRFYLTGSNQPLLKSQVVQTLAGRAAYVYQSTFHMEELKSEENIPDNADSWILKGFYPPLYDRPFEPVDWFAQYITTYLEKDLSRLIKLKDLHSFTRFLQLCAGRTGQILNMSDLARDADISHTTAKNWLSILEAGYIIFFLKPWHENFNKRLVKSPKMYFWDTGLAAYLAGIYEKSQINTHPLRGAFFETLVVSDQIKRYLYEKVAPEWYFWSAPRGPEVDLLRKQGQSLKAIEIKSSKTFKAQQLKHLHSFSALSNNYQLSLELRYDGDDEFVQEGVEVRPWQR